MKKVLYVVGAVVATFYFLNNKKKKNVSEKTCEYKNFDDKVEEENGESSTDVIISKDEPLYEDVKNSAIGSMHSRHEGAATIMSDSVDVISRNIKAFEIYSDEIDDISVELDRMISED